MASRAEWFAAGWFGATLLMVVHLAGQYLAGWTLTHWSYWLALGALMVNSALTIGDYHGWI